MTAHRHTHLPRRPGRAVVLLAAAMTLPLAAAAVAQNASDRKRDVDQRLERAEQRLQRARAREEVLTSQVAVYSSRLREVEARLTPLQSRLATLEAEIGRLEARLAQLNARLIREKQRLAAAEDRLASQRRALADRLRYVYAQGEVDPLLVVLTSGSLTQAVEAQSLIQRITDRDGTLVTQTRAHAEEVRATRDRITSARDEVQAAETRTTAAAAEVRSVTTELEARRSELSEVRSGRAALLARVTGDRREIETETADLRARSAELAARIVQAQAGYSGPSSVVRTPSSSGMAWPVSGTFTSPFGMRWGRMHEGIDIAVGEGTPVAAAASGRVISAGWSGGYGNLVVVDHGGGIATAYAHNSRLLAGSGQQVGQGQVIALSGNTGHSTGPHVHFEVRVNGAAVDPMNYL